MPEPGHGGGGQEEVPELHIGEIQINIIQNFFLKKILFFFQNVPSSGLQVQGGPLDGAPHRRAGVGGAAVVQGSREQGAGRPSVLVGRIVFEVFICGEAGRSRHTQCCSSCCCWGGRFLITQVQFPEVCSKVARFFISSQKTSNILQRCFQQLPGVFKEVCSNTPLEM